MLVVAGVAIGDQNGGGEYLALQLARQLDKARFEPIIFAMWQYDSPAEKWWLSTLDKEGIPVMGLVPNQGSILRQLQVINAKMWDCVNIFHPAIIHSHSQRGDVPNLLIHIFHSSHPYSLRTINNDQPWLNRRLFDLVFGKLVFPFCFNEEIAISECIRGKLDRRLIARIFRKKSILCHNGIGEKYFENREKREGLVDLQEQHPLIGVVGRLVKQKGHSHLLEALRLVLKSRPVHLWIIGSGPLEKELHQQAVRMNIEKYVHFLGPRGDLVEVYRHLDILVSSSLWEGFPTVLLEAMASSTPIIATDVSGSQEIIKNGVTGLLVPPKSSQSLADAIIETLNHPDQAHEMAGNARRLAEQYTVQKATQRYSEIYERLVGKLH
jgi:glycosyltransferase involved in cell wall biosynthesis